MFKNKQAIGGIAIAGVLAVVTLVGPATGASLLANTASANYGGSGGGTQRVNVCQNGKTLRVAKPAERALLAQGATKGACLAQPQVLGASTTPAVQAEKENLQRQLITLLQQLLALLKAQQ